MLASHLCLFTIIGMLLFTIGERVSTALAVLGDQALVLQSPPALK